jgi:hypothetical protein
MGDPVPSLNLHTVTAIAIDLHHTAKLSAPGRKRLTWSGKECVSVITRFYPGLAVSTVQYSTGTQA